MLRLSIALAIAGLATTGCATSPFTKKDNAQPAVQQAAAGNIQLTGYCDCDDACCEEGYCDCPDGCECGDGSCGCGNGNGNGCNSDCGGRGCGKCGRCGLLARLRGHKQTYPEQYSFQPGPPTGQVAYPYYTTRGPRDFLIDNPPTIGPR